MHDIPQFAHPGFRRQKASTPGSFDPGVEEKERRRNNDEHWLVVISSSVFRCFFCDFIIPYKPNIMNKQSWKNYAHYYFLWVISVYFATPLSWGIMKSPDLQLRIRELHKGRSTMKNIDRKCIHTALTVVFVWPNHTRSDKKMEWTIFCNLCTILFC